MRNTPLRHDAPPRPLRLAAPLLFASSGQVSQADRKECCAADQRAGADRTDCGASLAGFTLLELLLALGLTVVLMSAVYSALNLYYRLSTLGAIEVERAQIARAVFTKISTDIRSVMFREEDTSTSSSTDETDPADDTSSTDTGSTDAGSDSSDTATVEFTDPADAYSGDSVGVFGTSDVLVLHISRPYRSVLSADGVNSFAEGDLKSVSYFLAGGQGSLQSLVSDQFNVDVPDDGITGLARMSGDRLAMTLADSTGNVSDMASGTELLAPEINSLSFEFHDGTEWLSEWDSTAEGRLPNAIGITIGFRDPEFEENSILARQPEASTDTYRIVVPIVVSQPFEGLVF